ncbi:MAG: TRAP transporter small permease [Betaproteobacteria bacterium]|jgi:TRAP-type C4-dicarboxylate transport system permease small subunit|nr:TRAP transporter small permease [Betaproteobacteria bacterium]
MEKLIESYERLYRRIIPVVIATPLALMTLIVFFNAIGRKAGFPFPLTVESVEALIVVSVYFGVALVALEHGHVNVTFATQRLSPRVNSYLDGIGHLLAFATFAFLSVAAWAIALESIKILEYRLAVARFPLWPFKTLFALGLTFMSIQLFFNAYKYLFINKDPPSNVSQS